MADPAFDTLLPPETLRLFCTIMGGLFGLLWGSFFNVCIYRLPAGLSIVHPRSYCYRCGVMVSEIDNIPVLSYLMLGGACRHCGTPYSARYAGVELLTGALFALLGWHFGAVGFTPAMLLYAGFVGLLIVATFTDIDHFIIPDSISVGGGLAMILATVAIAMGEFAGWWKSGLLGSIARGWPLDTWASVPDHPLTPIAATIAGGVAAAGGLYLVGVIGTIIFGKPAMGLGDVKLMIGIGAILGVVHSVVAFFLACVLGAIISVSWLVTQWLMGKGTTVLRESFSPAEGSSIEVFRRHIAEATAPPAVDSPTQEPSEAPRDAEPQSWQRRVGEALGHAAREPRPRDLTHLPFGPYLALAAIIVLLYHDPIQAHINEILYTTGYREVPEVQIYWETGDRPDVWWGRD
jgi:leader peptidase (prepilin peptidase)/N-methyltransferase